MRSFDYTKTPPIVEGLSTGRLPLRFKVTTESHVGTHVLTIPIVATRRRNAMTYLGSRASLYGNLSTERGLRHCLFICLGCGFCHTIMYLERSERGAKDPYGSFALSHIAPVQNHGRSGSVDLSCATRQGYHRGVFQLVPFKYIHTQFNLS